MKNFISSNAKPSSGFLLKSSKACQLLLAVSCCLLQTTSATYAEEPQESAEIVHGPSQIKLGNNLATINLPKNYIFLKPEATKEFLKKQGSSAEGVLGMLGPEDEKSEWAVICRFDDCGYVTDDDAGKLNANDILNSYKDGTKEQNEERKEQNIPPIYVGDWTEKPHYEKAKHQVIWAIQVKDEDGASAPVVSVNYNTRILGRKGVMSMNLVTDPNKLETNKKDVLALLNQTSFMKGENYSDYQPGKDKSAGYGIAGLVLGGGALAAAAKFGILGAAWKWILGLLLIGKKFAILIIAGVGALIGKMFKKKPAESPPSAPPPQE